MIMQRQSDGTYSQIGFIRTPTEDIEQIVDKNGVVYFTKGFTRHVSGYPATLPDSISTPLLEYKVYGNIQQNGTPSPESPVEVQSVGSLITEGENSGKYEISVVCRGKNLFDETQVTTGYINGKGNLINQENWRSSDFIPVVGETYTFKRLNKEPCKCQ